MVYITFADPNLERELEIEAIADSLGMNFNQQDIEWGKRLLEEASIAAEKSLKERYPRDRSIDRALRDGTDPVCGLICPGPLRVCFSKISCY